MKPDPNFEDYHRCLVSSYNERNYESSLAGRFMRHSHRLLELPFDEKRRFDRTLEVASGRGEHLAFVRHQYSEYYQTDLSTEMLAAVKPSDGAVGPRIVVEQQDATQLSYDDASFDRVIATHVLEHLYRPHEALREWDRVLRPGGVLSIVLPCDPGILWRLGRSLGPRDQAEKAGIMYDYWMAREHVNPAGNLVTFINYYFEKVEARWYPMRLPSVDLNLFYIANITKPV